jgi:probable HAF family extracellular repeat protein
MTNTRTGTILLFLQPCLLLFLSCFATETTGIGAGAQTRSAAKPLPRYRILDLGFVPHNADDVGVGLNAAGDVAGWTEIADSECRATLWSKAVSTRLGTLPGCGNSYAVALNKSGQAVGLAKGAGDARFNHGFLAQGGKMKDLGALGGKYSVAHAINDAGQVVGDSLTSAGERHGFLWQNGKMEDIGAIGKGNTVVACGINNRGQIAGAANLIPNGKNHAFLWEQGTMRDLGLLPGGTFSYGYALNESGEVVGWADDARGGLHAFAWQNDKMQDLGTLGDDPGAAWSVNNQGQIVGSAATEKQRMHAFLYEKGRMSDLNSLVPPGSGWILTTACRINDAGQIAGLGWHGGKSHAFLLTPQAFTIPVSTPRKASVPHAPSKASRASAAPEKASAHAIRPLTRPTFQVRFRARDTEGQTVSPSDYRGRDTLVCFFCGCSACHRVAQAWAQVQQGGVFASGAASGQPIAAVDNTEKSLAAPALLVVFLGDRSAAQTFCTETGLDRAQTHLIPDADAHLTHANQALPCPRIYVLDRQGSVRYTNHTREDRPPLSPAPLIVNRILDVLRAEASDSPAQTPNVRKEN